jgi:hypothetical protein
MDSKHFFYHSEPTYLGFDENSSRHLYLYSFDAQQFDFITNISTNNFYQSLFFLSNDTIKRVIEIKKEAEIKYLATAKGPLLENWIIHRIKKALTNTNQNVFKIIMTNHPFRAEEMFELKNKIAFTSFIKAYHLIKQHHTEIRITRKQVRISKDKILIPGSVLMMIHLFYGINPNIFFSSKPENKSHADWNGIHLHKVKNQKLILVKEEENHIV